MHWPTGPSNKLKTSTGRKCQLRDVSVKYFWTRLKTEVKKTAEKNPANSHFFGTIIKQNWFCLCQWVLQFYIDAVAGWIVVHSFDDFTGFLEFVNQYVFLTNNLSIFL